MHNPFLIAFFNSLNNEEINYIVLRNYEFLPASTGGSDLDIFINIKDQGKFLKLLEIESKRCNGFIVSRINSTTTPRYCIMGKSCEYWGLMIDLHLEEIKYRNQVIISNKTMWDNAIIHNGITVLKKEAVVLLSILKELLHNGNCSKKYYDDFVRSSIDRGYIIQTLYKGDKIKISDCLINFKNVEYSKSEIGKLVFLLDMDYPLPSLNNVRKISKLIRLFKQPGYTIAFLGTDGSGKSSLIQKIIPILNESFHKSVYYEHLRPNLIPSISKLLRRKEQFNGPVLDPHSKRPSGVIGSLIRFGYYAIDYTCGYFLKIFPKKAFKSCVWIFDRYYYDYLIDQRRLRISLPNWLLKWSLFFIPEPDLIICLGARPEIIHSRKPELPLEEVQRQVNELSSFCQKHKKAIWVDTECSIELSLQTAYTAISAIMKERFKAN